MLTARKRALASRIVADPEGDEPLAVSFTLDVYDFGRPAQAAAAQEAKEAATAPADGGKADSAKPPAEDAKADEKKPAEKKAEKGDFE